LKEGHKRGTKGTVLFVPLIRIVSLSFFRDKKRGTKRTVPFVPLFCPFVLT